MGEPTAQDKLNMSLDDLLTSKKSQPAPMQQGGGAGGSGLGVGGGRGRGLGKRTLDSEREGEATTIKVARRIYVSNLSYRTTWYSLKDHFKAVGNVTRADVLMDNLTGRSKGCGIVEFATSQEAAKAIEQLDESQLDDRTIYIREDREDPDLKEHLEATGDRPRSKAPRPSYGLGGRGPPRSFGRGGGYAPYGMGGGAGPAVVGRRLYVHNLSYETDWRMLKDHFRQAGDIVHADVLTDPSGKSKGCGIVEYRHPTDALRAMQMLSNTELDGRPIHVREDREDRETAAMGYGYHGGAMGMPYGGGGYPGYGYRDHGYGGRGAPRRPADPGCQVVVHGIPYEYSWQDLKDFLRPAGNVAHVDITLNEIGRSKGYGTAVFGSPADAQNAIQTLNGTEINGRIITVKLDKFA